MTTSLIDTQLDSIEQQLNELSAFLLGGAPHQMQVGSNALQQLAVNLMQIADEEGRSSLRDRSRIQRIKTITSAMQPLREGLLRHSAYVERALEIMLPSAQQATYAGGAKYGGAMRQSGAFKVLSA